MRFVRKLMIKTVLRQDGAVYAPFLATGNEKIDLITPQHFDKLPDGATLICIDGKHVRKGIDVIDGDTRGGFLAYGFPSAKKTMRVHVGPYRTI